MHECLAIAWITPDKVAGSDEVTFIMDIFWEDKKGGMVNFA